MAPTGIALLSDDECVCVLSFLTARDLAAVSLANKTVFSRERVSCAARAIMQGLDVLPLASPLRRQQLLARESFSPSGLFVLEVTSLLAALSAPAPLHAHHGYWISTLWCTQAKRYFESLSLSLPSLLPKEPISPTGRKSPSPKKASRALRQRERERDRERPSAAMNEELLCEHGGLALASSASKRRLIERRAWLLLRRFFPTDREFCGSDGDCVLCRERVAESRARTEQERDSVLAARRIEYSRSELQALLQRKSGVPQHRTVTHWLAAGGLDPATMQELSLETRRPLLPGTYNLVPRPWLRLFRRFLRDTEVPALPPVDCTRLLCYAHGLLVVPAHVEEFLVGVRRNLLGSNVHENAAEVAEIVTAEEWDELQRVLPEPCDFNVRFCLREDDGLVWNVGLCQACDPSQGVAPVSARRAALTVTVV